MEKTWLPDSIRSAVNGKKYEENQIGMSGSKVLVFDDMVLKIQKASMETENEVRVCNWLKGRLPVPEIIEYCVSAEISYCLMSRISGKMACDETYLNAPEKLLEVVTDAIKMLWSLDIADCPCDNTLDVKLEMAKYNVENGLVDLIHPGVFCAGWKITAQRRILYFPMGISVCQIFLPMAGKSRALLIWEKPEPLTDGRTLQSVTGVLHIILQESTMEERHTKAGGRSYCLSGWRLSRNRIS